MNTFYWIFVIAVGLSCLITIGSVGKPREPLSGGMAALIVLVNVSIIVGILVSEGVLQV